ncbi:hypothetical protein PSOS111911_15865 [Pseudoalteromonas ostreae]
MAVLCQHFSICTRIHAKSVLLQELRSFLVEIVLQNCAVGAVSV